PERRGGPEAAPSCATCRLPTRSPGQGAWHRCRSGTSCGGRSRLSVLGAVSGTGLVVPDVEAGPGLGVRRLREVVGVDWLHHDRVRVERRGNRRRGPEREGLLDRGQGGRVAAPSRRYGPVVGVAVGEACLRRCEPVAEAGLSRL